MTSRDAGTVSTARTPIGRAFKGAFHDVPLQDLAACAVAQALERTNRYRAQDPWFQRAGIPMDVPVLHTAEIVGERHGVRCDAQDEYAHSSQRGTAVAQAGIGARVVGHVLREGRRRGERYAVVTMCVEGGVGAAGFFKSF
ncbi:hypothetical protein [Amycolatopsis panacis]|uniref:Uncharacterized protein n=1 Tax=Amycolatopsis panacis TaxID=2340917 RepID=A0A419I2L4_9PSEU|nr:hypothetical protein [Amycolatopsis panacis]RJQ84184.1 hypothetical protein D5S19_17790 [Amycolatopsis panacis]